MGGQVSMAGEMCPNYKLDICFLPGQELSARGLASCLQVWSPGSTGSVCAGLRAVPDKRGMPWAGKEGGWMSKHGHQREVWKHDVRTQATLLLASGLPNIQWCHPPIKSHYPGLYLTRLPLSALDRYMIYCRFKKSPFLLLTGHLHKICYSCLHRTPF